MFRPLDVELVLARFAELLLARFAEAEDGVQWMAIPLDIVQGGRQCWKPPLIPWQNVLGGVRCQSRLNLLVYFLLHLPGGVAAEHEVLEAAVVPRLLLVGEVLFEQVQLQVLRIGPRGWVGIVYASILHLRRRHHYAETITISTLWNTHEVTPVPNESRTNSHVSIPRCMQAQTAHCERPLQRLLMGPGQRQWHPYCGRFARLLSVDRGVERQKMLVI
mmetsp:Transcript_4034/g.11701  ORF Transcript_4034/g.11701 Transcript_4034/m.11701 type:complete len:218 (-) Transcript_4034:383-1036(-)